MEQMLKIVKTFSQYINMEFGLDKCATATFMKGKLTKSKNIKVESSIELEIRNFDPEETYKYLGLEEGDGIDNKSMKNKLRKEYYRRIRKVLDTELCAKNKIKAINTIAIPVMTYSFGLVEWPKEEIKKIDRKTRKLLTSGKIHHPKDNVDRIYMRRLDGGRGLLELEEAFETAIMGLSEYIKEEKDELVKIIKKQDEARAKYSITKEAARIRMKYDTNEETSRNMKLKIREEIEKRRIERLKEKPLYGQFMRHLDKNFVNKKSSIQWLNGAGLKGETESLIMAAQNQALSTRYRQKKIFKQNVDSRYRLCHGSEEHVSYIIAGCTNFAATEYTHRHNKVAGYIHWNICKAFGMEVCAKYYEHIPETITNIKNKDNEVTVMWDLPIITDRQINANRPDIVVHDKKNKTCQLIDISVPDDSNVQLKENEKIMKYKNLEIEISRMWNAKSCTIPVIVGALGTISKGAELHLNRIPGKSSIQEVQKITLLSTAHILRKALN